MIAKEKLDQIRRSLDYRDDEENTEQMVYRLQGVLGELLDAIEATGVDPAQAAAEALEMNLERAEPGMIIGEDGHGCTYLRVEVPTPGVDGKPTWVFRSTASGSLNPYEDLLEITKDMIQALAAALIWSRKDRVATPRVGNPQVCEYCSVEVEYSNALECWLHKGGPFWSSCGIAAEYHERIAPYRLCAHATEAFFADKAKRE